MNTDKEIKVFIGVHRWLYSDFSQPLGKMEK